MPKATTAESRLVHSTSTRRLATDPSDAMLFYRADHAVRQRRQGVQWTAQVVDKPCTPQVYPPAPVETRHWGRTIVLLILLLGVGGGFYAYRELGLFDGDGSPPAVVTIPSPPPAPQAAPAAAPAPAPAVTPIEPVAAAVPPAEQPVAAEPVAAEPPVKADKIVKKAPTKAKPSRSTKKLAAKPARARAPRAETAASPTPTPTPSSPAPKASAPRAPKAQAADNENPL